MVTHVAFLRLGVPLIDTSDLSQDPQTPEEFIKINYDRATTTVTWEQFTAAYQSLLDTSKVTQLRAYRNRLLAGTDWLMTQDVFETLDNQAEWIAYRQALRDLPDTQTTFVWKNGELQFAQMNLPSAPPILKKSR